MRNESTVSQRQRGIASMLAMLFLVLFATLAVGFYASTDVSSQVSTNDEHISRAFLASETGMDFMKYHLAKVNIPKNTSPNLVLGKLFTNLQTRLNGTGNLGSLTIAQSGNTISIPGGSQSQIKLNSTGETSFRVTITDWAGEIVVKSEGRYGTNLSASRAITMDFSRQERQTSIFNYAVASKGQIVVSKGAVTSVAGISPKIAALMSNRISAGAINVTGGTIGGDLYILNDPSATATVTGGSVGGSSIPSVIQSTRVHMVDPPEFPDVDPSIYRQYATNTFDSSKTTQKNIYVAPNTNPNFNGNTTVQGIMYIASPNVVTFNGTFNLQGFIVMEKATTSTTDTLNFSGNLTMDVLPNQPVFDPLRATSGVAVMAPTAAMNMTGSSSSLRGNVLTKSFSVSGAANVQIDQGSIITLGETINSAVFNTSKSVTFSATGANNQPKVGVNYSTYYVPKPDTYQEVVP